MTTNIRRTVLPYNAEIWNGTSDSILSSLYRGILIDLGFEETRWKNLVDRYVQKVMIPAKYDLTNIENDKDLQAKVLEDISSTRTNMYRELMEPTMTWKFFLKGIPVLGVKKMVFHVSMNFKDPGKGAVVGRTVVFSPKLKVKDGEFTAESGVDMLSALFTDAMSKLDITTPVFTDLMKSYIERMVTAENPEKVSSIRGSLKKSFLQDRMSWSVFIKSLNFLQVTRFEIAVGLYHDNGRTTVHYRRVSLLDDVD